MNCWNNLHFEEIERIKKLFVKNTDVRIYEEDASFILADDFSGFADNFFLYGYQSNDSFYKINGKFNPDIIHNLDYMLNFNDIVKLILLFNENINNFSLGGNIEFKKNFLLSIYNDVNNVNLFRFNDKGYNHKFILKKYIFI